MMELKPTQNVVLIGMPGVGKSTVGVLLAKATSRPFLDTDVYIQAKERRRLQSIIDAEGIEAFCALEERYVLMLACRGSVIATGGSVVYGGAAMRHLKSSGVVVHLDLALPDLERRVLNLDTRGVVMAIGQTLQTLFEERQPLYQRYADVTVDCAGLNHEEVVTRTLEILGERPDANSREDRHALL